MIPIYLKGSLTKEMHDFIVKYSPDAEWITGSGDGGSFTPDSQSFSLNEFVGYHNQKTNDGFANWTIEFPDEHQALAVLFMSTFDEHNCEVQAPDYSAITRDVG